MKNGLRNATVLAFAASLPGVLADSALAQPLLHLYEPESPLVAETRVWAISPDGATVVGDFVGRWFGGISTGPFARQYESPRASPPLLGRSGEPSSIRAISPEGRFAAGAGSNGTGYSSDATVWDLETGQAQQYGSAMITGLSQNAQVAVGYNAGGAVAWADGVPRALASSTFSRAQAVSADGGTITGFTGTYATPRAAVWTSAGESLLPLPSGATRSAAYGISADGGVVVGYAGDGSSDATATRGWLTRWTRSADGSYVPTALGDGSMPLMSYMLPQMTAAVSPDGTTVGGMGRWGEAMVWSAAVGEVRLNELFAASLNLDLSGSIGDDWFERGGLVDVTGISGDNRTIVGNSKWSVFDPNRGTSAGGGSGKAYRAVVPAPGTTAALAVCSVLATRRRRGGFVGGRR